METIGQQIPYRRTTEWIVTILTIGLVVLTVATYSLDQNKSNWICGPILLLLEIFAIGLQSVLTVIVWKTDKQKTKIVVTITNEDTFNNIIYSDTLFVLIQHERT